MNPIVMNAMQFTQEEAARRIKKAQEEERKIDIRRTVLSRQRPAKAIKDNRAR